MKPEIAHLRQFIHSYECFPAGEIEFSDKPDLFVHRQGGIIGIEHTQLFRRTPTGKLSMQSQESLQDQITLTAKAIYSETSSQHLWVSVTFDRRVDLTKKDIQPVAKSLSKITQRCASFLLNSGQPDTWLQTERWSYNRIHSNECSAAIRSVKIRIVDSADLELWAAERSATVPRLTIDLIQSRIDEKNEKLTGYSRQCNEFWLLIVAHGFTPSTHFQASDDVLAHKYETKFNRVFYMHSLMNFIAELNTTTAGR